MVQPFAFSDCQLLEGVYRYPLYNGSFQGLRLRKMGFWQWQPRGLESFLVYQQDRLAGGSYKPPRLDYFPRFD
jgi:hypothetical protein